jgi:peptide/nickel transport system permease protein
MTEVDTRIGNESPDNGGPDDGQARRWPSDRARRFLRSPSGVFGTVLLLALTAFALAGPFWPRSYRQLDFPRNARPSGEHPLGTDQLGADVFAQLIRATLHAVPLALNAALVAGAVGVTLASLASHLRGTGRAAVAWVVDLALVAAVLSMFALLGSQEVPATNVRVGVPRWALPAMFLLTAWVTLGAVLRAARRRGWHPTAELVTLNVVLAACFAPLYEYRLGFLGYGPRPPETSLPMLLSIYRHDFDERWWLFAAPFSVMVLIPIAVYFVAIGLRDAWPEPAPVGGTLHAAYTVHRHGDA